MLQPVLRDAFAAAETALHLHPFIGEVSLSNLDTLTAQVRPEHPDVIVGIGGGKALDAAKGVALRLGLEMISVPTIASTDAPASRGIVIYAEDHGLGGVEQMPRNPMCVLVDTAWIARAPARFLSAGIGDAIAKKFEVDACPAAGGINKHGTPASRTALAVADACYDCLRKHGPQAMAANADATPNAAFEGVVEACVLMRALAFENGGLSLAHAMEAASADMAAATRYMLARASSWGIDPNRVAVAGFSAGARTALNATFGEKVPVATIVSRACAKPWPSSDTAAWPPQQSRRAWKMTWRRQRGADCA